VARRPSCLLHVCPTAALRTEGARCMSVGFPSFRGALTRERPTPPRRVYSRSVTANHSWAMKKSKAFPARQISIQILRKAPLRTEPTQSIGTRVQRGSPPPLANVKQAATLGRRDVLVLAHLPLVKGIAAHVKAGLPVQVDLDDLTHAEVLGLIDAANRFDSDRQVPFSSYTKHRIKGAILDSLRQLGWASRDMRRRQKEVELAAENLTAILHRAPTETEIATKLGLEVDHWRAMRLDLGIGGPMSASTRNSESDDLPPPDFPCKPETHPDSIWAQKQLRGVPGEASKSLPERYKEVVQCYYTRNFTMKEITLQIGCNEGCARENGRTAAR